MMRKHLGLQGLCLTFTSHSLQAWDAQSRPGHLALKHSGGGAEGRSDHSPAGTVLPSLCGGPTVLLGKLLPHRKGALGRTTR